MAHQNSSPRPPGVESPPESGTFISPLIGTICATSVAQPQFRVALLLWKKAILMRLNPIQPAQSKINSTNGAATKLSGSLKFALASLTWLLSIGCHPIF